MKERKIICINDDNLPLGAKIIKGEEYEIKDIFTNSYDQMAYMLVGIDNTGRTKYGLPWIGYASIRFADLEVVEETEVNYNYELN